MHLLPPQVMSMPAQHQPGTPGSCSDPRPPEPGPLPPEDPPTLTMPSSVSAGGGGGPKELVKRAALRDVHVSVALMDEFLRFASANTARGVETCGILAGSLSGNDSTFTISTLIIPKQRGTTDTVEMLSEEVRLDLTVVGPGRGGQREDIAEQSRTFPVVGRWKGGRGALSHHRLSL